MVDSECFFSGVEFAYICSNSCYCSVVGIHAVMSGGLDNDLDWIWGLWGGNSVYDIYGMTEKECWLDYWKPTRGNRGANGVESSNHDVCLAKVDSSGRML